MNIYVEWYDFFGEERAVPVKISGEDPTFGTLFSAIEHNAGVQMNDYKLMFSNFDITSIDDFSPDKPLSWIGIGDHATIRLEPRQKLNMQKMQVPETDMDYTPPRFSVDNPEAYKYLEENGYVVIREVLSSEQISIAKDMCWEWIEAITGSEVRRNDVQSWGEKAWPADKDNGIIRDPSIGQADWLWYIREKPSIKQAFSRIWGTDRLGVSFDGGNLFRPYAINDEWRTKGGWFHVDQNAKLLPGKCCVQGSVYLKDGTKETGGLTVIPKSHLHHEEFCERNPAGGHFLPINDQDPVREMQSVLVTCRAGDLVLWDSRTVHCNTPGSASTVKDELIRILAYICMQPVAMCAEEGIEEKRKSAYERHVTSSHWVSMYNEGADPENFVQHANELTDTQLELVWPD